MDIRQSFNMHTDTFISTCIAAKPRSLIDWCNSSVVTAGRYPCVLPNTQSTDTREDWGRGRVFWIKLPQHLHTSPPSLWLPYSSKLGPNTLVSLSITSSLLSGFIWAYDVVFLSQEHEHLITALLVRSTFSPVASSAVLPPFLIIISPQFLPF